MIRQPSIGTVLDGSTTRLCAQRLWRCGICWPNHVDATRIPVLVRRSPVGAATVLAASITWQLRTV
jgi:hypothetical protein